MKPSLLILAPACLVLAGAVSACAADRITASPTLPKTATEKQTGADAPPMAAPAMDVGQTVYSFDGRASARVAEVVRDKEGKPTRVILETPDGVRRYSSVADLSRVRGRLEARLTQAQIRALPKVEVE
jgi:hypothetical protein